jgi:hypothetical protein
MIENVINVGFDVPNSSGIFDPAAINASKSLLGGIRQPAHPWLNSRTVKDIEIPMRTQVIW